MNSTIRLDHISGIKISPMEKYSDLIGKDAGNKKRFARIITIYLDNNIMMFQLELVSDNKEGLKVVKRA